MSRPRARPWLAEPECNWYDEEEAAHRRMTAWVDALTDTELQELQASRGIVQSH